MASVVKKNRSPPLSPLLIRPPKKYFKSAAQIRPATVENYDNMEESEEFVDNHHKRLKVDAQNFHKVLTRSPPIEMSSSTSEDGEENYCTTCEYPLLHKSKFFLPQYCSICMYNVCSNCMRTCDCCGVETFCLNCCGDFQRKTRYKRCRDCSKCSFDIVDEFENVRFYCSGLANSIYYDVSSDGTASDDDENQQ